MTPNVVTPIAWYRRDEWPAIRAMSADQQAMWEDFDRWLIDAQRVAEQAQRNGSRILRVHIEPRELAAFCRTRGVQINGHARTALACDLARQVIAGARPECPVDAA